MKARCKLSGLVGGMVMLGSVAALAGDGETSASASNGWGRPGSAAATAHYAGDVGFARSDTRTGNINAARSVALGVDENGLALSLSSAIAPRYGPAVATNFNFSIDRQGRSSHSLGTAIADGGRRRAVAVGGGASSTPGRPSYSRAQAHSGGGVGSALARTTSSRPGRPVYAPARGHGGKVVRIAAQGRHIEHRKVVKRVVKKVRHVRVRR